MQSTLFPILFYLMQTIHCWFRLTKLISPLISDVWSSGVEWALTEVWVVECCVVFTGPLRTPEGGRVGRVQCEVENSQNSSVLLPGKAARSDLWSMSGFLWRAPWSIGSPASKQKGKGNKDRVRKGKRRERKKKGLKNTGLDWQGRIQSGPQPEDLCPADHLPLCCIGSFLKDRAGRSSTSGWDGINTCILSIPLKVQVTPGEKCMQQLFEDSKENASREIEGD
jgi:hypothetical protein